MLLSLLAAAIGSAFAGDGGPLAGRWQLVEQRYQKGAGDLAVSEDALLLDFSVGKGAEAKVRFGRGDLLDWPAVVAEEGPVPLNVSERIVDLVGGRATASYTLAAADGEGWKLEMTEDYRLGPEGDLRGALTVRMTKDGESRGGYVLSRRFERRP